VLAQPSFCTNKKYKTRLYSQGFIGTATKDAFYFGELLYIV